MTKAEQVTDACCQLWHTDAVTRLCAADRLGQLDDASAIGQLRDALSREDEQDVRDAIRAAIQSLRGRS